MSLFVTLSAQNHDIGGGFMPKVVIVDVVEIVRKSTSETLAISASAGVLFYPLPKMSPVV